MTATAPVHGQNFFAIDADLHAVIAGRQPEQFERWRDTLSDFGAWVGGPLDVEAKYTDRYGPPVLQPYGPDGALTNHIAYNPLWTEASCDIYRRGIVGLNYGADPASYLITFVMGYLTSQSDVSLHCPATMTGAVAHVLNRFAPDAVRNTYLPDLIRMDGEALTAGTWATERHGGSDVGATQTVARADDGHFQLNGLKWFTSNVDGGIAIATARPEGGKPGSSGLGLYLVPTVLPDGAPNPMRIRRLKDKLGTCGVATGEVDLTDTYAVEIAPPPKGFKLMMEALEFSRIHNAMSAVGLQRRALWEALAFAVEREAFGATISTYPMVQRELIRMRVDLDADLALAVEAAHAFDQAWQTDVTGGPVEARTWLRLVTALAKYRTAENANRACRAAIELIGGNGYTYDFVTPRLLRDAQVLTVWEGPANIQALEVMRLLDPRYAGFAAFEATVIRIAEQSRDQHADLANSLTVAMDACRDAKDFVTSSDAAATRSARRLMHAMADLLAAALLVEQAVRDAPGDSSRKALVARIHIAETLAERAPMTIDTGDDWLFDHFEELLAPDLTVLSKH